MSALWCDIWSLFCDVLWALKYSVKALSSTAVPTSQDVPLEPCNPLQQALHPNHVNQIQVDSSCAPLFIIPTRLWFGLVRTTICGRTLLGCNVLQLLNQVLHLTVLNSFSNQEAFHEEGAK